MIKGTSLCDKIRFKHMNALNSCTRSFSMISNTNRTNFNNNNKQTFYPITRSFSMIPRIDEENKNKLKSFGYIGIGAIGIYGLSTFVWDLMYNFLVLTPYDALRYGFLTGTITTGACAGMLAYGNAVLTLDAGVVANKGVSFVNSNEQCRTLMSGSVKAGKPKTFVQIAHGGLTVENNWLAYVNPKIKMIFQVESKNQKKGIIALYAERTGFYIDIKKQILKVSDSSIPIVIKGNKDETVSLLNEMQQEVEKAEYSNASKINK